MSRQFLFATFLSFAVVFELAIYWNNAHRDRENLQSVAASQLNCLKATIERASRQESLPLDDSQSLEKALSEIGSCELYRGSEVMPALHDAWGRQLEVEASESRSDRNQVVVTLRSYGADGRKQEQGGDDLSISFYVSTLGNEQPDREPVGTFDLPEPPSFQESSGLNLIDAFGNPIKSKRDLEEVAH